MFPTCRLGFVFLLQTRTLWSLAKSSPWAWPCSGRETVYTTRYIDGTSGTGPHAECETVVANELWLRRRRDSRARATSILYVRVRVGNEKISTLSALCQ